MKEPNLLPHNLYELRTKAINWRQVTNDFDFYTIRDIVERWDTFDEQRIVARIIGSNMSVDKIRGINNDYIQPALDLLTMYTYKPETEKRKNMEFLVKTREEEYRRKLIGNLKSENEILKKQVEKLKAELEGERKESTIEKEQMYDGLAELDDLRTKLREAQDDADSWRSTYMYELEEHKREKSILKEVINEKPNSKKFNVRQTAIVAYALCKKAKVLPKNKKHISQLFNYITGNSANTIGQNMCSVYKEDEIEQIAKEVEDKMPEFAEYLREKTFFLPEIKK